MKRTYSYQRNDKCSDCKSLFVAGNWRTIRCKDCRVIYKKGNHKEKIILDPSMLPKLTWTKRFPDTIDYSTQYKKYRRKLK